MTSRTLLRYSFHPLAEVALLFCLLYLPRMTIRRPGWLAPGTALWHIALGFELSAGAALLLYVMARRHGLGSFFPDSTGILPRTGDIAKAFLVLIALALAAALPFAAASLAGWNNPLLEVIAKTKAGTLALLGPIAFSSVAVGYSEELFFRVYAFGMLREAGMNQRFAAFCASLIFAGAHAAQGPVGMLSALILGCVFQYFWTHARRFHAIALGHAFYDFAIFLILSTAA